MKTDELKKLVEAVSEDWTVGEYDSTGGYDCLTGAIMVGNLCLDGSNYGQEPCREITEATLARMIADAQLAGLSPDLAREVIALREAAEEFLRCEDAVDAEAARAEKDGGWSSAPVVARIHAFATLRAEDDTPS
jgi:hypothetical protein